MPILWFEQHVQMNEEIADTVKLILKVPHIGQMMGAMFVLIGIIQMIYMPLKKYLLRRCCPNHSKISDLSVDVINVDSDPQPEISPLISIKPKHGCTFIGKTEPSYYENNNNDILKA